ncbi:hypothetical protein [Paraburkholderia terrae]|nr:hypothetical protein [Paraburkholderia terrae]GJH04493.1 hypothetical protein CBA19C8_28070 [Paraburkholderia terrae]
MSTPQWSYIARRWAASNHLDVMLAVLDLLIARHFADRRQVLITY